MCVETFWIIICILFVNSVIKQPTFSRMEVLTSPKNICSTWFTKKFENQCKSRRVRFTRVLQCYFYSGDIHKAHKGTKSRFLIKNSVF